MNSEASAARNSVGRTTSFGKKTAYAVIGPVTPYRVVAMLYTRMNVSPAVGALVSATTVAVTVEPT